MKQVKCKDVYRLPFPAYIRRVAYFLVTSLIVVLGTVVAIGNLIASPVDALYVLPINIFIIALGVNTGYHMYFTHRAFATAPALKVVLAYLGSITCQDAVIQWVVTSVITAIRIVSIEIRTHHVNLAITNGSE
jgi:fatty-acid desaturase